MATPAPSSSGISERNKAFWDELCGSQLARQLGVVDSRPESLKRFDDWYFEFYPYLETHIPVQEIAGHKVLEVGLGYGSVAQRLAECCDDYQGLDIAEGPVVMANHRLQQSDLSGQAWQGSILDCPFPDSSFDWVIAIGCYHHTGNLQRALDETRRVLKPGGQAVVMIYNAYSYRRWRFSFGASFTYWLWDKLSIGQPPEVSERERAQYDAGTGGSAAPETVFTSVNHMRRMTREWKSCEIHRENTGGESVLRYLSRATANRFVGPVLGLDLYCRLAK